MVTRAPRTSLLITIPFVLLLNSDQVVVTTRMYGDLSGVRRVQVSGDSSLREELVKWAGEMTRGYHGDGVQMSTDSVKVYRSTQKHNLAAGHDVQAVAYDIVRRPLSFVTYYTWQETIKVDFLGNERERAAAPVTQFEYRLTMPGTIESTSPAASVDGRHAVWSFTADKEEYEVKATAKAVRWDAIVFLVCLVGYPTYRFVAFLVRRARLRPRKI